MLSKEIFDSACAGLHFAQSWLFLNMSQILAIFDVWPHPGDDLSKVGYDSKHIR